MANGKKADERFNEERHLNSGGFSYSVEFSYYCRLKNGTHENPTLSTFNRDAEALGRRSSFGVIEVSGSATGCTESSIVRAN